MSHFKDTGEKTAMPEPAQVYYPKFHVDLKKFPELREYKLDEKLTLTIRGKVCGLHADEFSESMDLEVQEIAAGEAGGSGAVEVKNEADRALDKIRSKSKPLY